MKFYIITAMVLAAVTLATGSLAYLCLSAPFSRAAAAADELAWLRSEFALNPNQLARIEQSHREYSAICAEHCEIIRVQRNTIAALEAQQAPAQELEDARAKAREFDAHCVQSVEAHARQIAEIIGGEQGERYLNKVLPRLASFDHATTPDLRLNSSQADASHACH